MIRVVEHPLARLAVDAVVRAADAELRPVGGASAALDEAAGAQFREQSRVQAPLEIGSAVITGAGDLTAEFVLHVVVQDAERTANREILRRALLHAWHRAEGWQLTTVGAPLGGLAVAPEEAALVLIETFRERARTTGFPAELMIALDDPAQRGAIEPLLALPQR